MVELQEEEEPEEQEPEEQEPEEEEPEEEQQSELVYYNAYRTTRFHALLYWYIVQRAFFPPGYSRISSFYLKKSFQS